MSKYGGQGAAAAVSGFKQGYSFIDQAESASQEAKLKEQRIIKATRENKLLDIAYENVNGESPETQKVAQLEQQLVEQGKSIKASNSMAMKQDINESAVPTNGKDRSKMVETLKTRFKTNPEIYKALGIQNAQTMSILNPRDQKDRSWMISTLSQQGISPESQGVESDSPEWASIVDDAIDGYPAMKADGSIVDLVGLSVATGASSMANPEYNARMEQNMTELRARLTRSGNNMEKALSEDVMPKYETVEQKEMVSPTSGAEIGMDGEKMDTTGVEQLAETLTPEQDARANVKEVIGGIESGGDYTTKPNKNGYEGKYQFRYRDEKDAGTAIAKKLGYTPEEIRNDPKKQEEVMDEYMDMNATRLENKGHEASPYNLWLAHNQGVGGANAIIKGKLTDTIRKNMKNQGVEGDTDEELIANYHAKFAPKMGEEPSAKSAQVTSVVTNEMSKQGGDKPLSDMRMRKVYALLGKSYPKDPNEPTAKMKNFEYLSSVIGKEEALKAVFPADNTKLGRMGKAMLERSKYTEDSKEYKEYTKFIAKLGRVGTASTADYNKAREDNKKLMLTPKEQWTTDQQADFESNEEIIQSYVLPSSVETIQEKLKIQQEAHKMSNQHASDIVKAIKEGTALSPEAEGDLRLAQQMARQSAPTKTVASDGELVEKMQANQLGANEIASVLNRFESGDLQSVEKGIVDNALQYVETKMPKGFNLDKDRQDTIDANIKAGSALGFLQATLIKAMSGTAASDAEVQRLTDVMQGNNWNQPEALKVALKEFYDVLERQQGTFKGQLRVSPYEGYSLSMIDKIGQKAEAKEATPDVGISKKVVKRGTLADGTKVVQYEDGTQGVE